MSSTDGQRIFELYVDQLQGESETLDEMLLVRLRWFSEDIEQTVKRITENRTEVVALVKQLSSMMQELDAQAGAVDHAHGTLAMARRWALVLPQTSILDDAENGREHDDVG